MFLKRAVSLKISDVKGNAVLKLIIIIKKKQSSGLLIINKLNKIFVVN